MRAARYRGSLVEVYLLAVGLVMRTENEQLKTVGPRLKGSNDLGRDPDRITCPDIGDLAIELDSPGAREDHVHLLSTPVPMSERRAFPGPQAKVRHSRLLGSRSTPATRASYRSPKPPAGAVSWTSARLTCMYARDISSSSQLVAPMISGRGADCVRT